MKYFLLGMRGRSLAELYSFLKFIRSEEGTSLYNQEENAIEVFKLFLLSLEQSTSALKVKDFLQFVAAIDQIPVSGFVKGIEVFFVNEKILPSASTCRLTLTLPIEVTQEMLEFAVRFGTS